MPCYRCGKRQTDPVKGRSDWARFVSSGEQKLICPDCQAEAPEWRRAADTCPNCRSARLGAMLGRIVCRECGNDFEAGPGN